ncbi:hypothetical protein AB7M29_002836 [Pseudomonas sp. F-14 TE3623]
MKLTHFIICYSFNGYRVVFAHLSTAMTEADACYLSFLHSGGKLASSPPCGSTVRAMRDFVRLSGITEVTWHRDSD